MQGNYMVPPRFFARQAYIPDNAADAATRSENALALLPHQIELI
jgi:hypothetical protein